MMSDVLYFFTTTLNLGNILSCAAVYPPSFYGSTPFLYKTNYSFQKEKGASTIVLYKELPKFRISTSESTHSPLVLAIKRKILKDELLEDHGDYFSYSGEIFLTPDDVRFVFFNEEAKKDALESTEKNLVCKFDHLFDYEVCPIKHDATEELTSIIEGSADGLSQFQKKKLEDVERLRGFCLGLALGQSLKKTVDLARLISSALKIKQRINNKAGEVQKRLTILEIREIHQAFEDVLSVIAKHDSVIASFLAFRKEISPEVRTFLRKHSERNLDWDLFRLCKGDVRPNFENLPDIINADQKSISILQNDYRDLREFLTPFYEKLRKTSDGYSKLDLSKSFALYEEMCLLLEKLDKKEDFKKTAKLLQLLVLFLKKKIVGEVGWSSSPERQTCEKFKQFCTRKIDSFDFQEVDDFLRGAFLFAQKPDDQLDVLIGKMEREAVADPSLPLAMWGFLNGFLAFPKTVMQKIVDNHSKIEKLFQDYEENYAKFVCKKNTKLHLLEIEVVSGYVSKESDSKSSVDQTEGKCEQTVEGSASKPVESAAPIVKKRRSKNTCKANLLSGTEDEIAGNIAKESGKLRHKPEVRKIEEAKIEGEPNNLKAETIIREAAKSDSVSAEKVWKQTDNKKVETSNATPDREVGFEESVSVCGNEVGLERKNPLQCEVRTSIGFTFPSSETLLLPKSEKPSVVLERGKLVRELDGNSEEIENVSPQVSKTLPSAIESEISQSNRSRALRKKTKTVEDSQLSLDLGDKND